MSTAALGYQKVVKENRILYNMVQDLKGKLTFEALYFICIYVMALEIKFF